MSHIVEAQKPVLETIVNVGKSEKSDPWFARSNGEKGPSVIEPPIFATIAGSGYKACFYLTRESEGSNEFSFKNHESEKYARPQSDPADGNVSVVEGDDSFLWTVTSADDGANGNFISVTSKKDGQTYYWGLSADAEDKSDIKLRTDSTDQNNHWRFWEP